MKYQIIFLLLFLSYFSLNAQTYNTAVGVRAGSGVGVSIVQRVADKTTLEGLVSTKLKKDFLKASILAKHHFPIFVKRFNAYTGGGFHKGWYTKQQENNIDEPFEPIKNPFGLTLLGGIEVSFGKFNISYDYKPSFNISGGEKAFESENGVTVRYIIFERPTGWELKKKKKKKKKSKGKKSTGIFDIFKSTFQ